MRSSTFFKPDTEFVKWLIELADNRIIFDVGCGNGHVMKELKRNGHNKLVGIDPFMEVMDLQQEFRLEFKDHVHLLPYGIEEPLPQQMIRGCKGELGIGIICRPCHSYLFIQETYNLFKESNTPLYYIGLDSNIEQDLDDLDISYEIIPHKGTSKENEKVYKLV